MGSYSFMCIDFYVYRMKVPVETVACIIMYLFYTIDPYP